MLRYKNLKIQDTSTHYTHIKAHIYPELVISATMREDSAHDRAVYIWKYLFMTFSIKSLLFTSR